MTKTVSFVSLGCAKNLVDSEVMIAKLGAAGWTLVPETEQAEAVVINTCAFIDPAKAESTQTILAHAEKKRDGQQLIVAGCLSQRFGDELQSLIPEIDGVVGTGAYPSIVELLEDARAGKGPVRLDFEAEPEHDFLPRLITTPSATAYLKIAEGCDHPCTFCIIPQLRGGFRSRSEESILAEARALAAGGTKELILIAQDTSMWGRDRGYRRGGLAALLEKLHAIDGIVWIRLLYLYPATVDAELIDAMASLPKVCSYMDMPLQHVSAGVLRRMLRPSNGERYLEIVEDFRRRVPGITMRSTFIVGFPGENDEDVAELERWIGRAELDRVGFFVYSREDGTPGAELDRQVPEREKRRRLLRLRDAQRRASERARAKRIGETVQVLVEEKRTLRKTDPLAAALRSRHVIAGRSSGEAPGVDGIIAFTGDAEIGEFVDVTLRGNTSFDFYGDLVPALVPA
ncbi:ribosomal protein S12 methylthiotransferase RimO [Vulcanimicrobium alpinum]|uniref:Ribosomal protein uS12 methylthiotransferase RimO n=1 Tax=Vulcanimicrobium alpinum TaxID=3016050 RepID=A0AAN2C913_UNVUL|nr:30S ribosomal protein S12 methylthiotransferase RimO [Vulcanimicrobium alpinum]BDE05503.1 ribosomal protein S12 methylthiotransferase RimO [Vulcanimicrobium alpinum]